MSVSPDDAIGEAILDAALWRFERFGIAKSTVEDVARRAKVARVTVYRRFPGKEALVGAVVMRELRRFQEQLTAAMDPFEDPADQVVEGFAFTLWTARSHPLFTRLLESEPEALLPHLTTEGAPFLEAGRAFVAARMASQLPGERTHEEMLVAADVAARLAISYAIAPGAPVDLDDPEALRDFTRTYFVRILSI
ncbi:TetR/AcrR family transcriptional regulator [Svornostia abyssi]|uniref:TetR/AcrR family transcriptional regulator n=1 Tax=Svornostia abyssi TaxID=2898438 RepID=A0ABY5PEE0_9ACTN|nr:TetR/AcrR family transcriptional regulator [Parviterribacteraceae bacterium J379]